MLEPHAVSSRSMDHANVYGHSRARTTSSNTFPSHQLQQQQQQQQPHPKFQQQPVTHYPPAVPPHMQHTRRSPSVNTFSTTSSMQPPAAYRTSSSTDLRRSISSRSGSTISQSSGYVALLRRQKATVWCDRAQYEDPRVTAQQRAAKVRANLEVVGGGGRGKVPGGRSSTGISTTGKVAAKIRHHGKTPVIGYIPGDTNHVGVGGVPLRLSATEVEGGSGDENDAQVPARAHHRRTGSSGRSSVGSGKRGAQYRTSAGSVASGPLRRSPGDTPEGSGSLTEQPTAVSKATDDTGSGRAQSSRSASSGERADNVSELTSAPKLATNSQKHSALTREKSVKNAEELKRRGSVDERTATLTSGRLFIANPDL